MYIKNEILIKKIEEARCQRYKNNFYDASCLDFANNYWENDLGFIVSYDDHGINRLIFFVKEWNNLKELVKIVTPGRYILEIMTKSTEELMFLDDLLLSRLMRYTNPNCQNVFSEDNPVVEYKDSVSFQCAEKKDAREINDFLYETFNSEISHLLSIKELEEIITTGKVLIHRNNNVVDAVIQADVKPKKFYVNQIINRADKSVIHSMFLNLLEQYVDNGGKYLYSWVEENNIASRKFHEKYGMKHDGMWNLVYCVENNDGHKKI